MKHWVIFPTWPLSPFVGAKTVMLRSASKLQGLQSERNGRYRKNQTTSKGLRSCTSSPCRQYYQIRKQCLRAPITRPCWHVEKRKEPLTLNLLQTRINWTHNSRSSQDRPDWASRPMPADVPTHVPTHYTAPPQEPDYCLMKRRVVDDTSAAGAGLLFWVDDSRFWQSRKCWERLWLLKRRKKK